MNQSRGTIDVSLVLEEMKSLLGKFGSERFSISLHDQSDELKWRRGRLDCTNLDPETNLHFNMVPQPGIGGSATLHVSNLHGNRIELTLSNHDDVILANNQFDEAAKGEAIAFGTSWYPAPKALLKMLEKQDSRVLDEMKTSKAPVMHAFWNCRLLLRYKRRFWTMAR